MTDRLPWLVVIDMQHAFGDPSSGWVAEGYADITPVIQQLARHFVDRVVYTRFVRDPSETGQWAAYYDHWSEFRVDPDDSAWDLTIETADGAPVITEPTFSKWGPGLEAVVGEAPLVLCGVATECCVLSTAYAAADAGRRVQVVSDACAGATRELHDQALHIMGMNAPLLSVVSSTHLRGASGA